MCNAGIETDEGYSTLDLPSSVFDENMAVNVRGVFLTARGAARLMKARGAGAIVAIGSSSGLVVDRKDPSPVYNATKAAVHMFARSLAVELAPFGIRVNAVAPGWIETGMTAEDDEDTVAAALATIPLGRYGRPGRGRRGRRLRSQRRGIVHDRCGPRDRRRRDAELTSTRAEARPSAARGQRRHRHSWVATYASAISSRRARPKLGS